MVDTFEIRGGASRFAFSSESLEAASAALPEGIYTTLRTYGGDRILRPEAHAERLGRSGAPLDGAQVLRAIGLVLKGTPLKEARLRITFAPPRLFVSITPFAALPPRLYAEGVSAITVELHRDHPEAKETGFISQAAQAYARLPPGVHEGLMVSREGRILEGLTSNVFFLVQGVLRTEEQGALPGVTRSVVLEVASAHFKVSKRGVRVDDLREVDECFLTSVSRGILPVVKIDDVPIGSGKPGAGAALLAAGFEALVAAEAIRVP